jgi:hypothetical protein
VQGCIIRFCVWRQERLFRISVWGRGAEETRCEREALQVLPYPNVPVYVVFED